MCIIRDSISCVQLEVLWFSFEWLLLEFIGLVWLAGLHPLYIEGSSIVLVYVWIIIKHSRVD